MRPLQLSFAGMRSYPGECGPLDFTDRSLVGVLGDTGAGKSTVLEAITYALYGTSTWHGGSARALIAEGAGAMSVDFTFVHADQRWRAYRVAHAGSTRSTHLLHNLDTGEQVDNRRPVDARIVDLLQLDHASFQAAVLLPQGRFDRLLTATDSERPQLLKGIFGVEALTRMRSQAGRDRDRLGDLVHEADAERRRLHPDPAAAAAEAAEQAAGHTARAAALAEGREVLRTLRHGALNARRRQEHLERAVGAVAQRRADGALPALRAVALVEQELAEQRTALEREREEAERRLADCAQRAGDAAARGHTAEALAAAEALLATLVRRLGDLAEERRRLGARREALQSSVELREERERELPALRARWQECAQDASSAAAAAARAREAWTPVNDAVGAALSQAAAVAGQRARLAAKLRELAALHDRIAPLRRQEKEACEALERAEAQRDKLRRADAAHRVAHGLVAGQDCPVCSRRLPEGFRAPQPEDPAAAERASAAHRAAQDRRREAERALHQAEAQHKAAQRGAEEQELAVKDAEKALEAAADAAEELVRAPVWARPGPGLGPLDGAGVAAALRERVRHLADLEPAEARQRGEQARAELMAPVKELGECLGVREREAGEQAAAARLEAETAAREVEQDRRAHERELAELARAEQRCDSDAEHLRTDIDDLPPAIRAHLADDGLAADEQEVSGAQAQARRLRAEAEALGGEREQAQRRLTELGERELARTRRREHEVDAPLRLRRGELDAWAGALAELAAEEELAGDGESTALPEPPGEQTADALLTHGEGVAAADEELCARAAVAGERRRERAGHLEQELVDAAAELTRRWAVDLPREPERLLAEAALEDLSAAEGSAAAQAEECERRRRQAEEQAPRAAQLDAALEAGRARLRAVDTLRAQLADAKFPNYLTERRTRALLGLAGELLSDLSGGRFGFTEDFRIINLTTRVARDPRTLSGGETFLASLSLALALVELYSRTGARLGALFLDEGFGALDAATLNTALDMLRAKVGGDKLIAVISHLHAVAEAVDDVLWVERGPAGSTARWLTDTERDALVNEEVAGLLDLS